MMPPTLAILLLLQVAAPDSTHQRLQALADSIVASRPTLPGLLIYARSAKHRPRVADRLRVGRYGTADTPSERPARPARKQHHSSPRRRGFSDGNRSAERRVHAQVPAQQPARHGHRVGQEGQCVAGRRVRRRTACRARPQQHRNRRCVLREQHPRLRRGHLQSR